MWGGLVFCGSTLGGDEGGGLGGTCGGSTLFDGSGGGLGIKRGGTVGGTPGGAWGSAFPGSVGNGVSTQVLLGRRVWGWCGCAGCYKISDNYQIASMVWAPKRAKGAAGVGLARAPTRRLDMSVAASAEDISGMALLWGGTILFLLCALPMSPAHRCGSIVSRFGPFRCTTLPCHGINKFASDVASHL